MPSPHFIAANSRVIENLLEHRFIFDLRRHFLCQPHPVILDVLKPEVDTFGYDLAISARGEMRFVQMKTRSGRPGGKPEMIAESLWRQPGGCVIWIFYDPAKLEPTSYFLLGIPLPPMSEFTAPARSGFRSVPARRANHRSLTLVGVADLLFPL